MRDQDCSSAGEVLCNCFAFSCNLREYKCTSFLGYVESWTRDAASWRTFLPAKRE
uniref:Uncharacterized protein n=1 Tax=Dromaius novaehollandiae TaxID=8790 RepID=A0A8C4K2A0_DRONO